jgi:ADP-heptose:LPS heptosyltransferase
LIIRLSAIGDVAMAAAVVRQAAERFPEKTFTMVSRPLLRPLFEGLPNLRFLGVDTAGEYRGLRGLWRLFRLLQAQLPDCVADIHQVLRTQVLHLLFTLSGRRIYSIKKGRGDKRRLTRRRKKVRRPLESTFERYRKVIERCVGEALPRDTPFRIPRYRCPIDVGDGRAIGVAPFAAHEGKIYPLERTEQVVAHFSACADTTVFLFGGGSHERRLLEQWERRYPNTRSVAGRFDLSGELALMQKLSVMISMDSANMHLASFVGTPVVSIWGATHPDAGFYGWRQSPENALCSGLPCSPCSVYGNKPCFVGGYPCLRRIAPEEIIKKVEQL